MKRILTFLISLLLIQCSGGTYGGDAVYPAQCFTNTKTPIKHHTNELGTLGTRGTEYQIQITVDGTIYQPVADTGSSNLILTGINPGSDPARGSKFPIAYGSGSNGTSMNIQDYQGKVDFNCGAGPIDYVYGAVTDFKGPGASPSILGLAYENLQQNPAANYEHTFLGQLSKYSGQNVPDEFSMLLCGAGNNNSHILIGGHDKTLTYLTVPITQQSYYVLNAYNVSVGSTSVGSLTGNTTILDSGTTLNLVPPAMLTAIVNALIAANANLPSSSDPFWNLSASASIAPKSCSSVRLANLPSISINMDNSVVLKISPNTYFKRVDGGDGNQCIFGFGSNQDGMNILGQVTMENYYVYFNRQSAAGSGGTIGFGPNTECNP